VAKPPAQPAVRLQQYAPLRRELVQALEFGGQSAGFVPPHSF
jgi:hypothetical protein